MTGNEVASSRSIHGAAAAGPDADVVIAGGGPAGLMLAIELCLGGVTPVVLERLGEISVIPKGNGLVGQIVPVLDYRGLLDRLSAGATYAGPVPGFAFGPLQLDFSRLASSPLHVLAIPQRRLEQILAERLAELGGTVRRGHELTGFSQDDDAVTISVTGPDGGYQLRAAYLAGCDGAHSQVRKLAGIGFPGITSSEVYRIGRVTVPAAMIIRRTGEVEVPGAGRLRPFEQVRAGTGSYSIAPLASLDATAAPDTYIVSTREDKGGADLDSAMTLEELQASVRRVIGAELPMTQPQWLSRVVANSRQADRYQSGRVLLAGDAAHVFGLGGSLNTGLLDALNLGWKRAAQARGTAPSGLLSTYHSERHAAGRRTLLQTRAQRALSASGEAADALRELVGELLEFPAAVRHVGELVEGSDIRYEPPDGPADRHPLAGRLAPDIRLTAADGSTAHVAELMRAARPLLLDLTPGGRVAAVAEGWTGRVPVLIATPLGNTAGADALLIRPDGFVAWATGPGAAEPAAGLASALTAWFGPPA
jgi:2-polyprenyl-6-methoxyphenol hydroxylase-like FAD-dependent oxidoreductase